jgi:hypothetical protein
MNNANNRDHAPPSLEEAVAAVTDKIGTTVLSEEELLVLAARELARTYTFDEKGYA